MYSFDAPVIPCPRLFRSGPERISLPSENTLRFKISRRDIYANWPRGPIREKGPGM